VVPSRLDVDLPHLILKAELLNCSVPSSTGVEVPSRLDVDLPLLILKAVLLNCSVPSSTGVEDGMP